MTYSSTCRTRYDKVTGFDVTASSWTVRKAVEAEMRMAWNISTDFTLVEFEPCMEDGEYADGYHLKFQRVENVETGAPEVKNESGGAP